MNIPIKHRNTTDLLFSLRLENRDRDIAQDTEAAADITGGMMACGPGEDINVVHLAIEHSAEAGGASAGREFDDVVGIRPDPRAFADITSAPFANRTDFRNVFRGMESEEVFLRRHYRRK